MGRTRKRSKICKSGTGTTEAEVETLRIETETGTNDAETRWNKSVNGMQNPYPDTEINVRSYREEEIREDFVEVQRCDEEGELDIPRDLTANDTGIENSSDDGEGTMNTDLALSRAEFNCKNRIQIV